MTPSAFISYSWDSEDHKEWVRSLAERFRKDGVNAILDRWHTAPGDQLPVFMEKAIRDSSFVVIICTPRYKSRSDLRKGGVGYEGDIMTAEVMTGQDNRKFIPVLRSGSWSEAAPSSFAGKSYIDLSSNPYCEQAYGDLIRTLLDRGETAPPIGKPMSTVTTTEPPNDSDTVKGRWRHSRNIFLDYLNPDLHRYWWGIKTQSSDVKRRITTELTKLTKLSLLWCETYCLLPPAFVFEDIFNARLIVELDPCISAGLLRFPLKPNVSFYQKAEEVLTEYRPVHHHYNQLQHGDQVLEIANHLQGFARGRIEKHGSTGGHIVGRLADRSDNSDEHWISIVGQYTPNIVDRIRQECQHTLDDGFALTHGMLNPKLSSIVRGSDIHRILHTAFGDAHTTEFDLVTLGNIFGLGNFYPGGFAKDKQFDFEFIRAALEPFSLLCVISNLSGSEIVETHFRSSDWIKFRDTVFRTISCCDTPGDVRRDFLNLDSDNLSKAKDSACQMVGNSKNLLEDILGSVNDLVDK